MFRKVSFSASSLPSKGACDPQDNQGQITSPFPSLIYYTAVAQGTSILSEYTAEGNADLPAIAATCLENVPSLHTRFSHTTNQRRFICLFEGAATYCAITDEALSKEDAYLFLEKVRDAFKAFGKGRGMSFTLGAHFLDEAMVSVMSNLAASFVGIPQKEKDRIQEEHQAAQRDAGIDVAVSSRSAVAPLHDASYQEFESKAAEQDIGHRAPQSHVTIKGRKGKKKIKEQVRAGPENNGEKTMGNGSDLQTVVDGRLQDSSERSTYMDAQKMWRRKVSVVAHWISSLA